MFHSTKVCSKNEDKLNSTIMEYSRDIHLSKSSLLSFVVAFIQKLMLEFELILLLIRQNLASKGASGFVLPFVYLRIRPEVFSGKNRIFDNSALYPILISSVYEYGNLSQHMFGVDKHRVQAMYNFSFYDCYQTFVKRLGICWTT